MAMVHGRHRVKVLTLSSARITRTSSRLRLYGDFTDRRHNSDKLLRLPMKQESPAIADKPARRESLPKIAPIRRAYNVVADDIGLSSFV